jgi:catechol 2,3-dioxygenase-like lactoylglutathione lyase family enzyme
MSMQITQIGTVVVPVSDQDRALEFYVGTLGFEKRLDAEFGAGRWIEVAPPGAETSIALVAGDAMVVSLTTTNADADHAHLREAGADTDDEVTRMPGGVPPMFAFTDTDGNRLRIVQRP